MSFSPIAISLSPNLEKDDVFVVLRNFLRVGNLKTGDSLKAVQLWFQNYFGAKEIFLVNSGRSALYLLLKAFKIGKEDEVLLQPFTCVAVVGPILWVGAKPIYIDIEETLNLNPQLLEKHINKKTRAIIVQHTFGIPAKIKMIKKIAQKFNLILIEDCAHALGAEVEGKKVGTFGDASFFSFGRDKVISSVFGGAILFNFSQKKSKEKAQVIKRLRKIFIRLPYPSHFWIFQQLFHPLFFTLILPLYNWYLGKIILYFFQKMNLLSKPIFPEENVGKRPLIFPQKFPNALAALAFNQLKKLERYNSRRREIANFYFRELKKYHFLKLPPKKKGAIYLRFNLQLKRAKEFLLLAKRKKILLGNWYHHLIDPEGVKLEKVHYRRGSCPKAEKLAKESVNLPTYPRLKMNDLKKIVGLFQNVEN